MKRTCQVNMTLRGTENKFYSSLTVMMTVTVNTLKCSICIQSELSSMSSMFSLRLFSSQYQLRRYSSSLCRSRHGLGIVSPKNVIKKMITFI